MKTKKPLLTSFVVKNLKIKKSDFINQKTLCEMYKIMNHLIQYFEPKVKGKKDQIIFDKYTKVKESCCECDNFNYGFHIEKCKKETCFAYHALYLKLTNPLVNNVWHYLCNFLIGRDIKIKKLNGKFNKLKVNKKPNNKLKKELK